MTHEEKVSVTAAMIRCNLMIDLWEEHHEELLSLYPNFANGDFTSDDRIIFQPSSSYLILGVSLLFAVVDFFKERSIVLPDIIRNDVEDIYPKLKEFRNCVFHVQGELLSSRQFALLDHPDSLLTIAKIHRELNRFLDGLF